MRLLVAFDGSDGGRDALELARVLAATAEEASALVVTVLFTGPLPMEYALLLEEEAVEAEPLLEEARQKLAGLDVETRAYGGGSPAGILTSLAEQETFDAIVVVTPPVAAPVMVPGVYAPESPPEPDKVIDEGVRLVDTALAVEPTRLDGDPALELTRACEEGVDLLILGSRGYGPLTRVLLGSVSRKVVRDAPCPVLAVRRP